MTSGKRRLDKLESNLTPKQAMLHWMAEAHQFGSLEEYARHMKTQPDNAWPLRRLGNQMRAAVEQTPKGRPKEEINRAQHQADLDVLFLFHLHQQANSRLAERDRYFATRSLLLVQQLSALVRENIHNGQAQHSRMMVGLNLPYPLDPETAAAVDAAIENHLIPQGLFILLPGRKSPSCRKLR